jgi:hypothetical protein
MSVKYIQMQYFPIHSDPKNPKFAHEGFEAFDFSLTST